MLPIFLASFKIFLRLVQIYGMSKENTSEFLIGWNPSDPRGRFNALRIAFEASEYAISHQADQLAIREQAARIRQGANQNDLDDLGVFHMEARDTFAKVFRGGFLISAWAVFESCVKDVSEYVRRKRKLPFGLQDLRAGDFTSQCEKFFQLTLDLPFVPEKGVRKQLELLKNFRNLLVHHDGSVIMASAELLSAGEIAMRIVDYHHDYLTPTARYNKHSVELVAGVAQSLADRVYTIFR